MEISRYSETRDYGKMLDLFRTEKDWAFYMKDDIAGKYKDSLLTSITYVAYEGRELIGYSRSIEDIGTYIYVCDLLVNLEFRGKETGRKLMECILRDYSGHTVYVMSDVDPYYTKLGYELEGSIYKVAGQPTAE